MTPPAPTCATDLIWWAFLFVLSVLGGLIGLLLKKGIIERLDTMTERQEKFMQDCHKCQQETRESCVQKSDYESLLKVRGEAHVVINGRLTRLETGQEAISKQIEIFHDDMNQKMTRLSQSFIVRDAVLSLRVDNLSEKMGSSWTLNDEQAVVERIEASLKGGLKP